MKCLELVYIEMYETFSIHACGRYGYFINVIYDYSKFGYMYLVHKKFDALDKFVEFEVELNNLLGKHIKIL